MQSAWERGAYRETPEGKWLLDGTRRGRWEDNIDVREILCLCWLDPSGAG
jgi:hypothetical protein